MVPQTHLDEPQNILFQMALSNSGVSPSLMGARGLRPGRHRSWHASGREQRRTERDAVRLYLPEESLGHSIRRACMGSIEAARRAGTRAANTVHAARATTVTLRITGS